MYVLSRPFIRVIYLAPRRSGISSNTSAFVSNQRIWEGSNFTLSYPLAAVYSSKVASSHQAWIAVRDLMKAYILRTSPRIFSGNSVSPACQLRNISSPTIYSLSLASFYSSRVVYKQLCLLNCYSGSMKSFMEKKLVGELPLQHSSSPTVLFCNSLLFTQAVCLTNNHPFKIFTRDHWNHLLGKSLETRRVIASPPHRDSSLPTRSCS